tara:strand:+ start:1386 stop:1871 length:486 start_codon:yes stop_codon:yes gene_type:complete
MNKILSDLALQLLNLLNKKRLKIGTAESCTGGMLAQYLTMHPGSSQSFNYSFITYSNEAKINILNVNKNLINEYGAVSKEVVCEMAKNLYKYNDDLDIAIAISGIAGPGGSNDNKPVGLVHHAIVTKSKFEHRKIIYSGNRDAVRKNSVKTTLEMAIRAIN